MEQCLSLHGSGLRQNVGAVESARLTRWICRSVATWPCVIGCICIDPVFLQLWQVVL